MKRGRSDSKSVVINSLRSPGFISKVFNVARDAVIRCINEPSTSNKDQILLAIYSAITAFLSTIGEGGNDDQGYRVAMNVGESIPRSAFIGYEQNKNMEDRDKRLMYALNTATGLVKEVAAESASGFSPFSKSKIADDVGDMIRDFSFYRDNDRVMHGKGEMYFGHGIGNLNMNLEWLIPSQKQLTGSGLFSWVSNWWNGTNSSESSPDLNQTASFDLNETDFDGNSTNSSSLDDLGNKAAAVVAGGLLGPFNFWQNASLILGTMSIPYVFKAAGAVGDWALHDTSLGKKISDKGWWKDLEYRWKKHDMPQEMQKLNSALSVTLPALAQDYILQKQYRQQYIDQVNRAREAFNQGEKERQAEILRENAVKRAENQSARRKALERNSDLMANYDNVEMVNYKKATEFLKEKEKAYNEFVNVTKEAEQAQHDFDLNKALTEATFKKRDAMISAVTRMFKGAAHAIYDFVRIWNGANAAQVVGMDAANGAVGNAAVDLLMRNGEVAQDVRPHVDAAGRNLEWVERYNEEARDLFDRARQINDPARDQERQALMQAARNALSESDRYMNNYFNDAKRIQDAADTAKVKNLLKYEGYIDTFSGIAHDVKTVEQQEQFMGYLKEHGLPKKKTLFLHFDEKPIPLPPFPTLEHVPDEIQKDDPILKKYVKREFIPPSVPNEVYSTPFTNSALQTVFPFLMEPVSKKGYKAKYKPDYVNPFPVKQVSASSGSNSFLSTTVTPASFPIQKKQKLTHTTPLSLSSLKRRY